MNIEPCILVPAESLLRSDELISAPQAIRLLGTNRSTFYNTVWSGRLPCFRVARYLVFRRSTILAYRQHLLDLQVSGDRRVKRRAAL